MYNYLVIGAGLMGSAAGRYLSQKAAKVAIIGAPEPADWQTHRGVFSSHYDQGRLASYYGSDEVWNALDKASINQYVPLEQASGISFYGPIGLISITQGGERYRFNPEDQTIKQYDHSTFPAHIPMAPPAGYDIYVEGSPSGYINPRQMVEAQLTVAAKHGATVLHETVLNLDSHADHVSVKTSSGSVIEARKVVLATGAFINLMGLLPRQVALRIKPETTILAQVSAAEAARMADMPMLNYRWADSEIHGPYLAPPLLYPDGNYYLKMGCDTRSDRLFTTLEEIQEWFNVGDTDAHLGAMKGILTTLFPDMQVERWVTKPCVVCYTPSGKPYVDKMDDKIHVLTGGNGTGAHPSDALGELMADLMITGRWQSSLDHTPFQISYADDHVEWMNAPLVDHYSNNA